MPPGERKNSTEGSRTASIQAVPAPPKAAWAMPSPMKAQPRRTATTDSSAQAMAMAVRASKSRGVFNILF